MEEQLLPDDALPKIRQALAHLEDSKAALESPDVQDSGQVRWYQRPLYRFMLWRVGRGLRKTETHLELFEQIARADALDVPVPLTREQARLAKKTNAPLKRVQ